MGAWDHGYFDNDGAADLLATLSQSKKSGDLWQGALLGAIEGFEGFLARDSCGETFRPITAEELAEQDAAVREALADFPHLIEEWDADAENETTESILCDTGDHEAQGAVAAAAIIVAIISSTSIALPRGLSVPDGLQLSSDLVVRAAKAMTEIATHARLREYVGDTWVSNVRRLVDAMAAC